MKYKSFRKSTTGLGILVLLLTFLAIGGCTHHEGAVAHRFDDIDRWVELFESPERAKWQKPEEVVKMLNLKQGDTVADIGAGTGYFTRRFAVEVGYEGRALGLDIEPGMVEYMRKDAESMGLKSYKARLVKPDDPELPPGSVDVVFICNTYHHIEKRVDYVRNLAGAIKPDGRVVIVDFYKKPLPVGPPPEGKLSEELVREEFREAGYRLMRSLDFLTYQYFLEFEPLKRD